MKLLEPMRWAGLGAGRPTNEEMSLRTHEHEHEHDLVCVTALPISTYKLIHTHARKHTAQRNACTHKPNVDTKGLFTFPSLCPPALGERDATSGSLILLWPRLCIGSIGAKEGGTVDKSE